MIKHNVFTLLVTYHRETPTYVDRDLYKNDYSFICKSKHWKESASLELGWYQWRWRMNERQMNLKSVLMDPFNKMC